MGGEDRGGKVVAGARGRLGGAPYARPRARWGSAHRPLLGHAGRARGRGLAVRIGEVVRGQGLRLPLSCLPRSSRPYSRERGGAGGSLMGASQGFGSSGGIPGSHHLWVPPSPSAGGPLTLLHVMSSIHPYFLMLFPSSFFSSSWCLTLRFPLRDAVVLASPGGDGVARGERVTKQKKQKEKKQRNKEKGEGGFPSHRRKKV